MKSDLIGTLKSVIWAAVLLAAPLQAQVTVTAVRHWSQGDVTRVVVEASADFTYTSDRLSKPDRIYFDIRRSRQTVSRSNDFSVNVGDGLVDIIRVAQNSRDVVRVVLYLKDKLEVKASRLANPHRLVLEVRGASEPVQLASVREAAPPPASAKPPAAPPPAAAVATPAGSRQRLPLPDIVRAGAVRERPAAEMAAANTQPSPVLRGKPAPTGPPVQTAKATPPPAAKTPEPQPEPEPGAAEADEDEEGEALIATPAQRTRGGGQSLTRALGLKLGRVVIDPGHGGRDTGTIGPTGLREKDVTLDVAKRLAELIGERMGSEVILTRTADETVPLEERTGMANDARADLFLSIHVNSSRYASVGGVESFYLSFTQSRDDLEVAARENAGSNKSIHELSDLVRKIALDEKIQESRDFAASLQAEVHALAKTKNSTARDRGVKKAPFVVLIGAKMPSVLVEAGFITNPKEEKLLGDADFRQSLAEALYKGLSGYASTLSHFDVARNKSE